MDPRVGPLTKYSLLLTKALLEIEYDSSLLKEIQVASILLRKLSSR